MGGPGPTELPAYIQAALRHVQHLQEQRGGARRRRINYREKKQPPVITEVHFQTPDDGYMLWTILAHAPDHIMTLWISPTNGLWWPREFIAAFYQADSPDIRLSSSTRLLHIISEDLSNVSVNVVVRVRQSGQEVQEEAPILPLMFMILVQQ